MKRNSLSFVVILISLVAASLSAAESPDWQKWQDLQDKDQVQAALELASEYRLAAAESHDAANWTRALLEEVKLNIQLGAGQTAAEHLLVHPWPENQDSHIVLSLFKAKALAHYLDRYSYQVRKREGRTDLETANQAETDLAQWSLEQITAEIRKAFATAWHLQREDPARRYVDLPLFLIPNTYPERIRGTGRDAVSYLWAEFERNSGYWAAGQKSGFPHSQLEMLMDFHRSLPAEIDLEAPPMVRFSQIMTELSRWHLEQGRVEAAHHARLEMLAGLSAAVVHEADRRRVVHKLETLQADFDSSWPWWSCGQWQLARLMKEETRPDKMVRAHLAAAKGARRHPDSVGGKYCASLMADITRPTMQASSMNQDIPVRRTIQVDHSNLTRVYLRAWQYDWEEKDERWRRLLSPPRRKEIEAWIESGEFDLTWQVDLPPTEDYLKHKTYISLPTCPPGPYVVAISASPDFETEDNLLLTMNVLNSDLVLSGQGLQGEWELQTRRGSTGEAVPGVELEYLLRDRSSHESHFMDRARTDGNGLARLAVNFRDRISVVARQGENLALLGPLNHLRQDIPESRQKCFIYSDRAVYRPGQTVHFKAVLYQRDDQNQDHQVVEGHTLTLLLKDVNNQEVSRLSLIANEFGSVSGQFELPDDGLLGNWRIEAEGRGNKSFRVEEYKRPTFTVELDSLSGQPVLNQPVQMKGNARFYFGAPVSEGKVTWHVKRSLTSRLPTQSRFSRRWRGPSYSTEIIAKGETELATDGSFSISFVPQADERLAETVGTTFRYSVHAEVTSSGGETREADRSYHLGFAGIKAAVSLDRAFVVAGEPAHFTVLRTNLDGGAEPGPGRWELQPLIQPQSTPLPGEMPMVPPNRLVLTEGDTLRPRWDRGTTGLHTMAIWPEGPTQVAGDLATDSRGQAELQLDELEPGPYRLRYTTTDRNGREAVAHHDFLVAGHESTPLNIPLVLLPEKRSAEVGEVLRVFLHSGYEGQQLRLQLGGDGRRLRDEFLIAGNMNSLLEIPITEDLRGGFSLILSTLCDFQELFVKQRITVPWDTKDLNVDFFSFRDYLTPGARESFQLKITGPDSQAVAAGTVEVLAYMYDRTLDLIARHNFPKPNQVFGAMPFRFFHRPNLGHNRGQLMATQDLSQYWSTLPDLQPDYLIWRRLSSRANAHLEETLGLPVAPTYEVRGAEYMVEVKSAMSSHSLSSETFQKFAIDSVEDALSKQAGVVSRAGELHVRGGRSDAQGISIELPPEPVIRKDFSETAFFLPHVQINDQGEAVIDFQVPDSVTDWAVWAHAMARDLSSGSAQHNISSRKDLQVRPYLPRFLREGDSAQLKVLVDNTGTEEMSGQVLLSLTDAQTGQDLAQDFGFSQEHQLVRDFTVTAGASADLKFDLATPRRPGSVVVKVIAQASDKSDGEQHSLPILPGRLHLQQSRFVALHDSAEKALTFVDMAAQDDPSLSHDQLTVTVDAQLFQGVLAALPFLVDYPYECTEQTLNRFLSTSIISQVYADSPVVAEMAKQLPPRSTQTPVWLAHDPNRQMMLAETPWLVQSQGGGADPARLINLIDPDTARRQRQLSLAKLQQMQTAEGGFPWWPGGRPSVYLTLYVLQGFSRAHEFGLEIPEQIAARAWSFLHQLFLGEYVDQIVKGEGGFHLITFMNYLLSSYSEDQLAMTGFTAEERQVMLDFSFLHWRDHSRILRGQLALTLARAGEQEKAGWVLDSVMDRAHTDEDLGTYWAPEERAWLWFNDSIEAHAFILRVLTEMAPADSRRQGLVQWLFLNRHLGQWKSTRATAEVIYALAHHLKQENSLAVDEQITVQLGGRRHDLVFSPAEYSGQDNHIVVAGPDIEPESMSSITVSKNSPGLAFASATWQFSTDELPDVGSGDFLNVTRQYFRRAQVDRKWQLDPLTEGEALQVGDQVEVHLDVSAQQEAEFIHLRDPRAAGLEPMDLTSGYRWHDGLGFYQETRDSGTNFFFDRLPTGTYTLRYRLRVAMAGTFRTGPATMQSMYAPEFTAYSAGKVIEVE